MAGDTVEPLRTARPSGASPDAIRVSVVIPCLNEAKTIADVIRKAAKAFDDLGITGEIVVADNGSTDGSIHLAESLGARVVHVPQRGYGSALRHGMREARGRFIVMGDADDTYDFGEMDRFVEALRGGADFVMGTRLPPGKILPGANPWLNRNLGTPVLTFLLNRLFGTAIRDVNCGMRAISREKYGELHLLSGGMEFASEMLIKAAVSDLRIVEVPVTLHPDRRGRPPHLRRWRDGWRHLEFMLLHAPDQLLFLPGAVLTLLGVAVAAPVSLGPVYVRGRMFDYHYLFLGGTLLLIGIQGILGSMLVRDVARGKVLRPNRALSAAADWLDLKRGLVVAALLFGAGFAIDALVLAEWVRAGFGPLEELRRTTMGLLLMAIGAELGILTFLHAAMRRHA